ncbi:hypothetical protein [Ferrimicrobium acidiphilum]|uniref:hypothetical protein n=1 Tax=Ferrimicrobium acidiphilum TaxID=121039 RepID=UPI0023F12328|nr:hypothetical protein [Ferrimicrobium acidiphilum]
MLRHYNTTPEVAKLIKDAQRRQYEYSKTNHLEQSVIKQVITRSPFGESTGTDLVGIEYAQRGRLAKAHKSFRSCVVWDDNSLSIYNHTDTFPAGPLWTEVRTQIRLLGEPSYSDQATLDALPPEFEMPWWDSAGYLKPPSTTYIDQELRNLEIRWRALGHIDSPNPQAVSGTQGEYPRHPSLEIGLPTNRKIIKHSQRRIVIMPPMQNNPKII